MQNSPPPISGSLTIENMEPGLVISTFLTAFCFIGVNCFVLLSGYYGIKCRLVSIINLYFICTFYNLLGFILADDMHADLLVCLKNSLFVFSHNNWWFIKCYICLYLISPILNAAISVLTKKEYIRTLIFLTIINVYLGYFWSGSEANLNGFTVMQFIYIYMIGAYLKKHVEVSHSIKYRPHFVYSYIILSVLWAIFTLLDFVYPVPHWNWEAYNNPLLLLSSISFFAWIMSFKFYNEKVNYLASSVLAAYLIQDHEIFGYSILYPLVSRCSSVLILNYGLIMNFTVTIIASFVFVLLVVFMDKLRVFFTVPILNIKKLKR